MMEFCAVLLSAFAGIATVILLFRKFVMETCPKCGDKAMTMKQSLGEDLIKIYFTCCGYRIKIK